MRINHLYIKAKREPIIGAWTIDSLLSIPAGLLPKIKKKERLENLHLSSRHKSVHATLALVSDVPSKSFLTAYSKSGPVSVDIVSASDFRHSHSR